MRKLAIVFLLIASVAGAVLAADKIDPKTATLEEILAAAEAAAKANDDATTADLLKAADERFPDDQDVAFFRMGWTYMRGQKEEALAVADAWLAKHPDDQDIARSRVGMYLDLDRDEDALAAVDAWLAAHPFDRGWVFTKADLLVKLKRGDEALAAIDAAAAAHADDDRWQYDKVYYLKELGRPDEAAALLEKLLAEAGAEGQADDYFGLGDLYIKLAKPDLDKAIAAYEKGLSLAGVNRDAYAGEIYNLGCAYALKGKKDKALALVKEALAAEPLLARDAEGDEDLATLRKNKEFEAALKEAAAKAEEEELKNMTVKPGEAAPAFALDGIDGKKYALADFKGQYVVLNVWATWCGPCRREIPELIAFAKAHAGEFALVSISVDEPGEDLAAFAADQGITYVILRDDGETAAKYLGAEGGIPQTYFIDKDGFVRGHVYGSAERATFENKLAKLLSGK